jgi:broad specificity phosphatase PhoE
LLIDDSVAPIYFRLLPIRVSSVARVSYVAGFMSLLTLVRHAQASFFAEHYDQLSALGEKQAIELGSYWCRTNRIVDEVYVGPRRRQQHTADLIAECYRKAGLPFPVPVPLPELDEYDLAGILQQIAPELVRTTPEFATHVESYRNCDTDRDRERNFQRMFEPLMLHWQTTEATVDGIEPWSKFRERVQRGLQKITSIAGRSRRVLAFTSGGFIGTAVHVVTAAPDRMALETSWRTRNASVTDFVFSGDRITLDAFNSVAHFTDPTLITFR